MQTQIMKSSLWAAPKSLELGTPTVARLGQPTEVAGEWRPPLPSTPTRCSGGQGSFPSRAPKEGSQRGAVTTLCTWRRSCSCCRAAQQEEPAELAGREPSAGGGWYGCLARLGAARAHGEAAWGAANVLLGSISTFTSQPLVARALCALGSALCALALRAPCMTVCGFGVWGTVCLCPSVRLPPKR